MRTALIGSALVVSLTVVPLASAAFVPEDVGSIVLNEGEFRPELGGPLEALGDDNVLRQRNFGEVTFDPGDDAAGVAASGLVAGSESAFVRLTPRRNRVGWSAAYLFATPEAARAFCDAQVAGGRQMVGRQHRGLSVREFVVDPAPSVGEYAVAFHYRGKRWSGPVTVSAVLAQRSNLVIAADVTGFDDAAAGAHAQALARLVDGRALALAAGSAARRPSPDGRGPAEPDLGALALSPREVAPDAVSGGNSYGRADGHPAYRVGFVRPWGRPLLGSRGLSLGVIIERYSTVARTRAVLSPIRGTEREAVAIAIGPLGLSRANPARLTFARATRPRVASAEEVVVWESRFRRGGRSLAYTAVLIRAGQTTALMRITALPKRGNAIIDRGGVMRLVGLQAARLRSSPAAPPPIYSPG